MQPSGVHPKKCLLENCQVYVFAYEDVVFSAFPKFYIFHVSKWLFHVYGGLDVAELFLEAPEQLYDFLPICLDGLPDDK